MLEMILVIAIIATLVILLASALGSARGQSRTAKCANNLRLLATAGLHWIADHNGSLPDRSYWPVIVRNRSTDQWSLLPYLGIPSGNEHRDSVLTCPAYSAKYRPNYSPEGVVNSWHRTYGLNMYLFGTVAGGGTDDADLANSYRRLSSVPSPSLTAFFFDGPVTPAANGVGTYNPLFQYPEWRTVTPASIGIKGTDYIHNGGINVVFLDGHLERITPEQAARDDLSNKRNVFWGRKP